MDAKQLRIFLQTDETFLRTYGMFQGAFASAELTIDFAIGKFLKIANRETHLLTSGMEHGRKIRLLAGIVKGSGYKNESTILGALHKIQNESLRNVFAHSYMISTRTTVIFIERHAGGSYRVKKHEFTLPKFTYHVSQFITASNALWKVLEVPDSELHEFAMAVFSAAKS